MEKMHFRTYGFLDWLDPEEFWANDWKYLHYAYGTDEKKYDIVELNGDYRYTLIRQQVR